MRVHWQRAPGWAQPEGLARKGWTQLADGGVPARSCVLTQRCSDVALAAASVCRAEDATCCIIIFLPTYGCGEIGCRRSSILASGQ